MDVIVFWITVLLSYLISFCLVFRAYCSYKQDYINGKCEPNSPPPNFGGVVKIACFFGTLSIPFAAIFSAIFS